MSGDRHQVRNIITQLSVEDVVAAARATRVVNGFELRVREFTPGIPNARITFYKLGSVGYAEMNVLGKVGGPSSIEVDLVDEDWGTVRAIWDAFEARLQHLQLTVSSDETSGSMTMDPPAPKANAEKERKGPREPTERTQKHFDELERLRKEYPKWTQRRIATEASLTLGETITVQRIRYIFRTMKKKWERSNRIR